MKRLKARFSIFKLSNIQFAWEISDIVEVINLPALTRVPNVSDIVLGVFNARGFIIPLIDIRTLLQLSISVPTASDRAMIIRTGDFFGGILINEVITIIDIDKEVDDDPVDLPDAVNPEYLDAVYKDSELGTINFLKRKNIIGSLNRLLMENK